MRRPIRCGGMAEWFKAAVLKTVERKLRGFESYSLRQKIAKRFYTDLGILSGEMAEPAEGARLLSECGGKLPPRVRIPLSPPNYKGSRSIRGFSNRPFSFYGW